MTSEADRHSKVAAAVAGIGKPLVSVAAAAVAITGLASVFGWAFLRGYFEGLGAPWAIAMMDPVQFLTQALAPFVLFGTLTISALYAYVEAPSTSYRLYWWGIFFLVAAGSICIALHVTLEKWVFETYTSHWNIPGVVLLILGAVMFFGLLVQLVVEQFNAPRSTTAIWIALVTTMIVGSITPAVGKSRGEKDLSTREFVPVVIDPAEPVCKWGLVRALSQERVLLSSLKGEVAFKIVAVEDVWSFGSSESVACPRSGTSR